MYSFRNRIIAVACLVSMCVQLAVPSAGLSEGNPSERTASVIVGKYDVVKDSHAVPFLDHLASNGIPAVYGEILEASVKASGRHLQTRHGKAGNRKTACNPEIH